MSKVHHVVKEAEEQCWPWEIKHPVPFEKQADQNIVQIQDAHYKELVPAISKQIWKRAKQKDGPRKAYLGNAHFALIIFDLGIVWRYWQIIKKILIILIVIAKWILHPSRPPFVRLSINHNITENADLIMSTVQSCFLHIQMLNLSSKCEQRKG